MLQSSKVTQPDTAPDETLADRSQFGVWDRVSPLPTWDDLQ
jgi:hypothetical protein